eukprot:NODE_5106_length_323_cov_774.000000_g4495_i0.p1 GENE.NODE_5106_length_323_cov_774.000000_g4495_i0~~NODE_5106_length_323_cov_774.000000_g4495_i0.p1  ORF type:complete len:74 (+),score=21.48 NODE_5106_length_323_cov_774.000000_g4495_i0:27-224(+)
MGQLKGFKKLPLQPGQQQTATLTLTDRDLSVWDVASHSFKVQSGQFKVYVGSSSRDIRLNGEFTV